MDITGCMTNRTNLKRQVLLFGPQQRVSTDDSVSKISLAWTPTAAGVQCVIHPYNDGPDHLCRFFIIFIKDCFSKTSPWLTQNVVGGQKHCFFHYCPYKRNFAFVIHQRLLQHTASFLNLCVANVAAIRLVPSQRILSCQRHQFYDIIHIQLPENAKLMRGNRGKLKI